MNNFLEKTTIAKNASVLVIADIITIILDALLTIAIARKLGSMNLGLLAFAVSFTRLFGFFTRFGFKHLVSRDVSKDPDRTSRYLGTIMVIKFLFSITMLIIIFVIIQFSKYSPDKVFVIYIAAFIVILDSYIEFLSSFFRAYQKAEFAAIVKTILHFLTVMTGLSVLFMGYGIVSLISVRLIVYFFVFLLAFHLVVRKTAKPDFKIERRYSLHLIQLSVPFAMVGVFVVINTQMGTILLSFIKGDEATGWFSAAFRLCGVVGFIPVAFTGAVLPAMAKFSSQNLKEQLYRTYEGTIKFLLIFILPIALGTTILAEKFVLLIYGSEYSESISVLQILIWFLVFSFLNHGFFNAFATMYKEKVFVRFQCYGTLIQFICNVALILLVGVVGVSIATLVSQMVIFVFSTHYLSKHFHRLQVRNIYMKPMYAILPMGVFLLYNKQMNTMLLVLISVVLYVVSLLLFKTFDKEELLIFRELLRKATRRIVKNPK